MATNLDQAFQTVLEYATQPFGGKPLSVIDAQAQGRFDAGFNEVSRPEAREQLHLSDEDLVALSKKIHQYVHLQSNLALLHAFDPDHFDVSKALEVLNKGGITGARLKEDLQQIVQQATATSAPAEAQAKIAESMAKSLPLEELEALANTPNCPMAVQVSLQQFYQLRVDSEGKTKTWLQQAGLQQSDIDRKTPQQIADLLIQHTPGMPREQAAQSVQLFINQTQLAEANWKLKSASFEYDARVAQARGASQHVGEILDAAGVGDGPGKVSLLEAAKPGGKLWEILASKGLSSEENDRIQKTVGGLVDLQKNILTQQAAVDRAVNEAKSSGIDVQLKEWQLKAAPAKTEGEIAQARAAALRVRQALVSVGIGVGNGPDGKPLMSLIDAQKQGKLIPALDNLVLEGELTTSDVTSFAQSQKAMIDFEVAAETRPATIALANANAQIAEVNAYTLNLWLPLQKVMAGIMTPLMEGIMKPLMGMLGKVFSGLNGAIGPQGDAGPRPGAPRTQTAALETPTPRQTHFPDTVEAIKAGMQQAVNDRGTRIPASDVRAGLVTNGPAGSPGRRTAMNAELAAGVPAPVDAPKPEKVASIMPGRGRSVVNGAPAFSTLEHEG